MSNAFACTRRAFAAGLAGAALASPLRASRGFAEGGGHQGSELRLLLRLGGPSEAGRLPGRDGRDRRDQPREDTPRRAQALAACHTGEVGGYVIEGHVPAPAIKRLLAEKPQATGLAVPGMPVGSPGMEVEGMEPDTYEVILFGPSGQRTFARYRGAQEA